MNRISQDLRYALRQLRKSPGFAAAVVLTLALSIGANTAIFSVVNALLLRPLPYSHPERIGTVMMRITGIGDPEEHTRIDGESWEQLRDNVPAVQAAVSSRGTDGVNLQFGSSVQYVHHQRVSAHYFDVLGIHPALGRNFSEEEDRAGGANAVILSYGLWRNTFHSDPHILGQAILLKGEPYTVVGVLPSGVKPPTAADLWIPIRPSRTGEGGGTNYDAIVRLRDGATWQQANAQLSSIRISDFTSLEKRYPGAHAYFYSLPLQQGLAREYRTPSLVLLLATGFILLIACANLAGLTLVRVSRRGSEIALRLALGATRADILRQLWIENLLLALLGALAGLAVGSLALRSLMALVPPGFLPVSGLGMDGRVLAFAFAAALFTSILFGMLPALQARRVNLQSAISAGGSRSVARGSGARTRSALIAGEVALTVLLLSAAGLLVRTLIYFETLPPGFDPNHVMTAKLSLDDARYHDPAVFQKLLIQSVAAMRRIPGVESAAVGLSLPYERGLNDDIKVLDGAHAGYDNAAGVVYVTPDYFAALRIPVLAGRAFTDGDTSASQCVAMVNQAFARKFIQQTDPIGRHLQSGSRACEIIGLASDVAKTPGLIGDAPLTHEPSIYVPATQVSKGLLSVAHIWFQPSWIVRTSGPVAGITRQMQQALASVDPNLPFSGFYAMKDILAEALLYQRIEVDLLVAMAALALLLSIVGIYGLVSNLVVQRTREIGIRIALGSSFREAMIEIGRSGAIATAIGIAAGLALSLIALRVMRSVIYGVRTYDPATLAGVTLLLAAVALTASLLPTLRIMRIDPSSTLREE
ncbi:MAG: ABC transporter permease [Acidobacteriaceae bacterium]